MDHSKSSETAPIQNGSGDIEIFSFTPKTFTPTRTGSSFIAASLNVARTFHNAVLLNNNKVLVTGGNNGSGSLKSAEIYDIEHNTWTLTPDFTTARENHNTILLNNGKALIAGGYNAGHPTDCEVYDPTTNLWSQAGSLSVGRHSATVTLLSNGKVLIISGYPYTPTTELFDPEFNTWSFSGSLVNSGRYGHATVLLPDNSVIVAGGWNGSYSNIVEKYSNGTWSNKSPLQIGRHQANAVLLNNGKIFIAGGVSAGDSTTNTTELYDPNDDTWTQKANMNSPRDTFSLHLLNDGKVLALAGSNWQSPNPVVKLKSVELYDPLSNTWTLITNLNSEKNFAASVKLPTGSILITGGYSISETPLDQTEIYSIYSKIDINSYSLSGGVGPYTLTSLDRKVLIDSSGNIYPQETGAANLRVTDSNGTSEDITINIY